MNFGCPGKLMGIPVVEISFFGERMYRPEASRASKVLIFLFHNTIYLIPNLLFLSVFEYPLIVKILSMGRVLQYQVYCKYIDIIIIL